MIRREDTPDAGFTLLEMLIVLALLSLLMVVLTGAISLGVNARARVTSVALDQQDFAAFDRILEQKLGAAYPGWVSSPPGTEPSGAVDFTGTQTAIAFLGPSLDSQGQGVSSYSLSLSQQNGKQAIWLQAALSSPTPPPAITASFAAGLASLKIKYFGAPQDGGVEIWQDQWVMHAKLPDLIALQVNFPKGDRRAWPPIVIHPQIDGDITCEIDASTHRCIGR